MKTNILAIGLLAALAGVSLVACDDDVKYEDITLERVTTAADRNTPIDAAAMGDVIAIHGSNLDASNIDSVLINDVRVDPGEIYSEGDVLFLKIPTVLPVEKTDRIYIYNGTCVKELPFVVDTPDLKLDRMFNEYTMPGDTITVYGDFFTLYEISPETAVMLIGDQEAPIIACGNNYFTAEVPLNAGTNQLLQLHSNKYNVTATCPGRYRDKRGILVDYDDHLSTNTSCVVTDPADEMRLSGNFVRVDANSEWSGWWYITEAWPCDAWTDDVLDHPENYVIKCEFRTESVLPTGKIGFYVYPFWDAVPMEWDATMLTVQETGRWETLTFPINFGRSTTYPENTYYKSFNVRLAIEQDVPRNFAFDNFRICPAND